MSYTKFSGGGWVVVVEKNTKHYTFFMILRTSETTPKESGFF